MSDTNFTQISFWLGWWTGCGQWNSGRKQEYGGCGIFQQRVFVDCLAASLLILEIFSIFNAYYSTLTFIFIFIYLHILMSSSFLTPHFSLSVFPLQLPNSRLLPTPKNRKSKMRLVTSNWFVNMAFIRATRPPWKMAMSCQRNLNHFRRTCTDDHWRKLIISYMKR